MRRQVSQPLFSDGLARLGSAAGFLFAYATQPDNRAFDGGGRNSPFAQAFLSHLPARGVDLNTTMIEIRKTLSRPRAGTRCRGKIRR